MPRTRGRVVTRDKPGTQRCFAATKDRTINRDLEPGYAGIASRRNDSVPARVLVDGYEPVLLVCSELLDLAFQAVVVAVRFHGSNRVVVGCSRLEVVHAHAEHGGGMAWIQSDRRFRCLAKILWTYTVVHDPEMFRRPAGIVAGPPGYHNKFIGFDFRPLGDPDLRGFRSGRAHLRERLS